MKSVVQFLAFGILFLAVTVPSFAQKEISEAHVKYSMTADGGMAAMMSGTTMDLYFNKTNAKVAMNMMNGMAKMDAIVDNKAKKGLLFLDMMGQKKVVEMDEKDLEASKQKNQKPSKVEYLKKYKKIAGYKCQQVLVTIDGIADPAVVYVTEKIKPADLGEVSMMKFTQLKGFPLSWEIKQQGMTVKMEATEVSLAKLNKKTFDMTIPEGYEKMTMEELQQLGGGSFGL